MTHANAIALGLNERIHIHHGDALTIPLPHVQAAFADPSRRSSSRRYLDPDDYTPPLSVIPGRFPAQFPLAVKIAPGVAWNDISELGAEVEFVSVNGELKETVLWFGPLRTIARRATVLPTGATLTADHALHIQFSANVQEYIIDPDPAIVRSGLTPQLAVELGLLPLDPNVALLTSPQAMSSPFLSSYRVELAARFHLVKLREHLRARHVGRVTAIKRGSRLDSDEVMRKLKLDGERHRVVILAGLGGEEVMIVGEKVR